MPTLGTVVLVAFTFILLFKMLRNHSKVRKKLGNAYRRKVHYRVTSTIQHILFNYYITADER
jgi:hypothetical protein